MSGVAAISSTDGAPRQILEIVNTGALRRIAYENTEEVKVVRVFKEIYGVGA
jgi:DNA polymerase lambda